MMQKVKSPLYQGLGILYYTERNDDLIAPTPFWQLGKDDDGMTSSGDALRRRVDAGPTLSMERYISSLRRGRN
jgi:hypothetical protein